jgi:lysophospholipase L1-like esterase
LPDQPKSYYDALPDELKHYQSIGQDNRDKSYFLQMYLADYRAVEYIAGRPDWDGKTLVVQGTSMGGQQSLCVAGLNPRITHLIVNEPAGCDTNGALHGRASGYPNWPSNNPKVMETALYFDAVNFASHIKATSLVAMGFVDPVAPPVGIWIAFNQIEGQKEAAPMVDSPHNNLATPAQQHPYTGRSAEWLNALVRGGGIRQIGSVPADRPVPRPDKNSQLAHQELLEKAQKGGPEGRIDVYFEGDSITRRWGASDAQYSTYLANWKQNFWGWNAADFGWGGDTTQNILWRLNNGELDNVNPKVIVLLAGTNNIGNIGQQGSNDPRIEDIPRGIKAILDIFRQKAPRATIILLGITPRNDRITVMPIIGAVNERISKFADGKQIRFININDKLADRNGRLYEGMTVPDKLHLDVKGYQVWADALKPVLTELLGPPAKEDHAPPPTGDPSARKPGAQ